MVESILIDEIVYFESTHPLMYLSCYGIEYTSVDDSSPTYAFNLFGSLDKVARRHYMSLVLDGKYALIHFGKRLTSDGVPVAFVLFLL